MSRAQQGGIAALISDYRHFAGARLWLSFALMILGALAEGFGLLMIVPLASIAMGADSGLSQFTPWIKSWNTERRFIIVLGLFLAAMAARSLLLLARDTLLARIEAEYEASLRLRSAATLARRGWPFASRLGQAGMQSLLLNDVPRAALAAGHMQQAAVGATMLFAQLAIAFILSPALTLVAIVFLAVAATVSMRFAKRTATRGQEISYAMNESAGSGFRLHTGLKAALAQDTVPAFLAEYQSTLRRTARQMSEVVRDFSSAQQLASFAGALVAALLLLVGVRVLALPFPVLVTSLVVFARMNGPAQMVQNGTLRAAANAPAFAAIHSKLGPLDWTVPEARAYLPLDWSELALERVGYQHQLGLGIADASLSIRRGEWIGFSGASGEGKTTLVDLTAGLLLPATGTIRLDGRRLEGDLLERWRGIIAYVGQDGSLFDETIRGNLLAEGAAASEADLWRVLETVGLDKRVRVFPGGLDEMVGDRGNLLSGGERQRLVIARAILRRPSFIILDEATAALDADGEAQLIERLKSLDPRPAALVVAHRASTLAHCDSIVAFQHGIVAKKDEGQP